jgi:hypothetical protein
MLEWNGSQETAGQLQIVCHRAMTNVRLNRHRVLQRVQRAEDFCLSASGSEHLLFG